MGRNSGHYDKEIEQLRRDKKKAQAKKDIAAESKICEDLGNALVLQGCYEEAIDEHRHELRLRSLLSDEKGEAVAHRIIGECFIKLGEFNTALEHLQMYLNLSRRCCSLIEEQRAWTSLGFMYLTQSDCITSSDEAKTGSERRRCLRESEKAFMKSLEICDSLSGDESAKEIERMKARSCLNLGLVYDARREFTKAVKYLEKAVSWAKTDGVNEILYNSQSTLAAALMKLSPDEWLRAEKTGIEAVGTARQLKKKDLQAEAYSNLAQVKVVRRDFSGAKKALKKAHQLSPKDERPKVMESLEQVFRLELLYRAVQQSKSSDDKAKRLEKMADKAASFEKFQLALVLYAETLKLNKELNKSASVLGALFFSLAQTYADDSQHDNAVKFFRKESQCQEDQPKKQCWTLLRIADHQKFGGKDFDTMKETYEQAITRAEEADDVTLQAYCLQLLIKLQKQNKKPEDSARLDILVGEHNLDINDLSEFCEESQGREEEIEESSDEEEIEVDLEDISDSDAEEEFDRSTQARRQRSKPIKRNEKGESPLHVAIIKGDLKRAKTLIQTGHPLSVQDFSGWTPMHEACNHGCLEIVDLLLSNGVNINDSGGSQTGGVTPLMDACDGGNTEIVNLLLDRGANPHLRDHEARTAMDKLRSYCERCPPEDLSLGHRSELIKAQTKLYKALTGKELLMNQYFVQPEASDDLPLMRRRSKSPEFALSDSDDEIESSPAVSESREAIIEPENARSFYKTAIKSMGSSAQRNALKSASKTPQMREKRPLSSMVDSSEFVGDDWLVNDVQESRVKRKPVDVDRLFPSEKKRRKTESKRENKTEKSKSKATSSIVVEKPVEKLDNFPDINANDFLIDDFSDDDDLSFLAHLDDPPPVEQKKKKPKQARLTRYAEPLTSTAVTGHVTSSHVGSGHSSSGHVSSGYVSSGGFSTSMNGDGEGSRRSMNETSRSSEGPMRLRIRVQNELMIIPVSENDQTRTVGWLCEQTTLRYSQRHGTRPRLALQTPDGALLASDDVIMAVIQPREELTALVQGWTERAMSVRYEDACTAEHVTVYANVKSALDQSSRTLMLVLSDLALNNRKMKPIAAAIQRSDINTLILNGNRIEGNIISDLVSQLPALTVLDLSSNVIDHSGFKSLLNGLRGSDSKLWSLSLSYNYLSDACATPLIELLETCRELRKLVLSGCRLTNNLFSTQKLGLQRAFRESGLEILDISNNRLGREGVKSLLESLPAKLKNLNISRTLGPEKNADFMTSLQEFLAKSSMEEMNLSGCHLSESELDSLIAALPKTLRSLSVSNNHVPSPKVVSLFQQSFETNLQSFDLLSCKLEAPLDSELMDSIISKMGGLEPLRRLSLSCVGNADVDRNSLVQVWSTVWEQKARSRVEGDMLKLWVEEFL